jgi:hypothetical protein
MNRYGLRVADRGLKHSRIAIQYPDADTPW